MTDAPIGIFDSGVGGPTVARAILDQLRHERLVDLAGTAHLPYGPEPVAGLGKRSHRFLGTELAAMSLAGAAR